jgi:peptide methionine sulfoxide reductase MsrB
VTAAGAEKVHNTSPKLFSGRSTILSQTIPIAMATVEAEALEDDGSFASEGNGSSVDEEKSRPTSTQPRQRQPHLNSQVEESTPSTPRTEQNAPAGTVQTSISPSKIMNTSTEAATQEPRSRSKKNQTLSFSMHSPRTPRGHVALPRSLSFTTRRRMHEVDGMPLQHWDRKNFETKRDETCRVVYEPKDGKEFFHKHLPLEDYEVMRSISLEQPYYSKYNRFFPKRGHFCCKACGNALYSHVTKFDAEDGWPAFGACVEGAIGVIPSEKRKAQIEQENRACVKIQAFIRGCLARIRVIKMLEEMIQQLLEQKQKTSPQLPSTDVVQGETTEGISNFATADAKLRSPLFSPTTVKKKIDRSKGLRYTLLRALGDDYTEIHCHRCKSHLGDVMEEENVGRDGREFQERHRVNGRALKYVEDDLPKRVMVESSLLFADPTKRRLLGLPSPKITKQTESTIRTTPFVSPRAQRRRVLSSNGVVSDPLSVSCHPVLQRKRGGFDALSVTTHEPARIGRSSDILSASCHTRSHVSSNDNRSGPLQSGRPIRRKGFGKFRATNFEEKRASLENFILSKSTH